MRKKNKLYKVNKWNQPLFMQGLQDEYNIFAGGGDLISTPSGINQSQLTSAVTNSGIGNYSLTQAPKIDTSNIKFENTGSTGLSSNTKNTLKNIAGGVAQVGDVPMGKYQNGAFDALDPVYHMAGGRESETGNTLNELGVNTFKSGAASGNPMAMLAGAAFKVGGGVYNALAGIKTDKKRLNSINSGLSTLNSYNSDATDYDDVIGPSSIVDNTAGVYKGAAFSSGSANRKNSRLTARVEEAKSRAARSMLNNIANISKAQTDDLSANFAAFGGPLGDSNSGAIDYGFMSDYLANKNKATSVKDKMPTNIFGTLQEKPMLAFGGIMQTNGADFGNLVHVDAGGSHEENPYQGVQMGISRENGQPNLVEEGETVFDDYVFSKRIKLDTNAKKKFHIGKNSEVTYADLSKRLEKESLERPNDPISLASLKRQLHKLAEEQERQKQEEQVEEMQDAFAQLPPEQQEAIMQQMAMEEQQAAQQQEEAAMAQQQAQSQDLNAEQQQALMTQQGDEQQGVQEQMMQEQPQTEEVQMAACGGKLNKFDKGGDMKRNIFKALQLTSEKDFNDWKKKYNLDEVTDWENILKNEAFMDALKKSSPALSDALSHNYDFGVYKASEDSPYNLDAFKDNLEAYTASSHEGNTEGKYTPDKDFDLKGHKDIKALEADPKYKAYTDYMKGVISRAKGVKYRVGNITDDPNASIYENLEWLNGKKLSEDDWNALKTLEYTANGTSVYNTGLPVPLFNEIDKDGYSSLADNAEELFEKYRTDEIPGIFHLTPEVKNRAKSVKNFEVDDKGNIYEIYNDVPKGWTNVGNYNWQDSDNDYAYNYYKRPGIKDENKKDDDTEIVPVHKSTWQRDLGLFGPMVGLGMQAAGIGKPDYSRMEAALDMASEAPVLAHYKTVPNYLTYKPMDIWYEQNRLNANSRATDRAITNNGSPLGTKTAGLLANGYNNQIASGDLFRKALEYNDAQRQKVEDFNRATNMYNADAFTKTSATNAGIINDHRRMKSQLALDIAKERLNTDASWYSNMYKNVDAMFKGLADYGKENAQHNMIADMAADNLFGTITDKQNIGNGYVVKRVKRNSNSKAKGGKVSRKKGLTF